MSISSPPLWSSNSKSVPVDYFRSFDRNCLFWMEETSDERPRDQTVPAGSDYEVFLSFRGPDTRQGITDHLYESMNVKGIRVFRDDEEIRRGEKIGAELERVIRGSRVYVVVFSRNYASSAWCLRELAMMVDCCRDSAARKIILPIFYDVDPYVVKLRTDLYRSALDKHRERYGEEEVKRWEEALVEVGGISGWDYKRDQGEGQFVSRIVKDLINKLEIRDRSLPDNLIGIDDGVEGVMNMLNRDSSVVRVVMVHGMGGIGKTTLANVIFNRISSEFDGCSYLANVRESSAGEGGIVKLQTKLLSDILGGPMTNVSDSSDGMNQIKRRLRGKRLLIVFDDVSDRCQLDELVGNCDFFGSGTRIIVTTKDKSVCDGLTEHCVVRTYEMKEMSDDHALQLFSRHAFRGEGPPVDFAALSEQVICATGNLPLALVVIGRHLCRKNEKFWKDTLQKLKQVPNNDVMKILRISYDGLAYEEQQIFLDIACLSDVMPRRYANYMWDALGLFPNLGVNVLLNKSLVKDLNDDEFGMHDLIQDMGREIVRLEGRQNLGMRSRLWDPQDASNVVRRKEGTDKVLAINLGWLMFVNVPDFAGPCFDCKEFEGMSNLRFLRQNGGQFIGDFRNFPAKLMWLHWEGCLRGSNLAFSKMNNLVVLKISGDGITDESMKDLRMGNLRALEIHDSSMTTTPDLSRCSKLERIIIKSCRVLRTLHSSVGELEDLTSLHIEECESLRTLPEELGSAKALQELSLIYCRHFEELPESIGRLGDLRVLRARRTQIRKLPTSIGNLKSLEVLKFEFCPLVKGIPQEIGGLSSLEELELKDCRLHQLPGSICQLSRLRSLVLFDHEVGELPELPSSLTKLIVQRGSLKLLPNLSSLTNLTELVLFVKGGPLEGMSGGHRQPLLLPGLEKLHGLQRLTLHVLGSPVLLSTELGSLSRLQELDLTYTDVSSLWQLPSSLLCLRLSDFQTVVSRERYSNLVSLHRLEFSWLKLTKIRLGGLDKFGNLSYLSIGMCYNLKKLSDLACMRRLRSLDLTVCPRLIDISGVEKMEQLEELTVYSCASIKTIPDLSGLTRLKRVLIVHCPRLRCVPCMIGDCYLEVSHCPKLGEFEGPYRQYHKRRKCEDGSI